MTNLKLSNVLVHDAKLVLFCVAYMNCKPCNVMIQDIYSWLDLSL